MTPDLEVFEAAVRQYRGNLTNVAKAFKVSRRTMHTWVNKTPGFMEVVTDERKRLFDDALTVAEVIALGIPERDDNKRITGWKERPDPGMIKFLLSTLGRDEGFGETLEITSSGTPIVGIMLPDNKRGKVVEIENFVDVKGENEQPRNELKLLTNDDSGTK